MAPPVRLSGIHEQVPDAIGWGYWIASGWDEIWAREGSIGVIGSQVNATGLVERLGLSYERLVTGEYKDAGAPLKETIDDDREYLQGLIDGYYDEFLDRVTEGRGLEREAVADPEARVYLGEDPRDLGLVDRIGTREDVEDALAERIGVDSVSVTEFADSSPTPGRGHRVRRR